MASQGCIYVNGEFTPPGEARIAVMDHGLLYGDGLFETLRTYGGRPFRVAEHLARLEEGMRTLAFAGAPDEPTLRGLLERTLARAGLPEAYLRLTVTRGVGQRGLDPSGCSSPSIIVAALPLRTYPEAHYAEGVSAATLWRRHREARPPPSIKTTSYQGAVLARAEVARRGVQEGLYLDEAGNVTEGTVSNVFCLLDGRLVTPPAAVCLPGITRAEVLSLAREAGLSVEERELRAEELLAATELFVTSSLAELLPVVRLDGRQVGEGTPGPVQRSLLEAYRARTRG